MENVISCQWINKRIVIVIVIVIVKHTAPRKGQSDTRHGSLPLSD